MNDYLIALCVIITIFTYMFLAMGLEKDLIADCINSATFQHYSVEDIDKLCGGQGNG